MNIKANVSFFNSPDERQKLKSQPLIFFNFGTYFLNTKFDKINKIIQVEIEINLQRMDVRTL